MRSGFRSKTNDTENTLLPSAVTDSRAQTMTPLPINGFSPDMMGQYMQQMQQFMVMQQQYMTQMQATPQNNFQGTNYSNGSMSGVSIDRSLAPYPPAVSVPLSPPSEKAVKKEKVRKSEGG